VHKTTSQYTLPALGQKIADKTNRAGGAERLAAPVGHKSIAVARALLTSDDALWRAVERTIGTTATHHDAHTLYLLHTVPGIGKILSLVRLYDIPQIDRLPRGQDIASSCRLGKCAKESVGKRFGTAGTKIGHAPLKWAFSAAAVFCLRENPAGPKCLTRLEKKPSTGKALTILAHQLARAVSCMFKNKRAFDLDPCLHSSGRGVGELAAERDHAGMTLTIDALPCSHPCVAERRGASRA
jgi:transposase